MFEIRKIKHGEKSYLEWEVRVENVLYASMGFDARGGFIQHGPRWENRRAAQLGYLEGLIAKLGSERDQAATVARSPAAVVGKPSISNSRVFIVHGHDDAAKESVARFIQKIGLEPIILHEQPNAGRTIIEKFEVCADVGFAIILLTPDDVGAAKTAADKFKPRARQNVIVELGYFVGKLGRSRVCPLHKPSIEIPSDFHGVGYVEMDGAGAWKTKLAQELVEAGLTINLQELLKA